ncbi:hypothetical protein BDK51DRAFT_43887 [Blyttiomyces helicus]|uniref:Uncharacterized protein n=1 Tax=Blyttiomyces helicus TaxID=388810 RepID=A0A4P9WMJ6_9FUNG|nr:hypothetical protein BDK51DRAFT_43887 [Blyttiomyces helicus]|eukprot:RKO91956.1 hypothetical protein BDK51DRAFT_43887 [Blyttiomyces helicus]
MLRRLSAWSPAAVVMRAILNSWCMSSREVAARITGNPIKLIRTTNNHLEGFNSFFKRHALGAIQLRKKANSTSLLVRDSNGSSISHLSTGRTARDGTAQACQGAGRAMLLGPDMGTRIQVTTMWGGGREVTDGPNSLLLELVAALAPVHRELLSLPPVQVPTSAAIDPSLDLTSPAFNQTPNSETANSAMQERPMGFSRAALDEHLRQAVAQDARRLVEISTGILKTCREPGGVNTGGGKGGLRSLARVAKGTGEWDGRALGGGACEAEDGWREEVVKVPVEHRKGKHQDSHTGNVG